MLQFRSNTLLCYHILLQYRPNTFLLPYISTISPQYFNIVIHCYIIVLIFHYHHTLLQYVTISPHYFTIATQCLNIIPMLHYRHTVLQYCSNTSLVARNVNYRECSLKKRDLMFALICVNFSEVSILREL